jgi:hypothetical protein
MEAVVVTFLSEDLVQTILHAARLLEQMEVLAKA